MQKAEFARALGVGRSTISNYVARGMPCRLDGTVDRDKALAWIKENVHPQAGRRGTGVRGAVALADKPVAAEQRGKKRGNGHGQDSALLHESVRLTRLRADRLALQNAKLSGGTDEERAERLANTIALHCWWEIQKHPPWAIGGELAVLAGLRDIPSMDQVTGRVLVRDHMIARAIRNVIRAGLAGRLRLVEGPFIGMPWEPWERHDRGRRGVPEREPLATEADAVATEGTERSNP